MQVGASPDALQDVVLPPSPTTKILSVSTVSRLLGPTTDNLRAFSSLILWQKAGIWHNNKEMYFNIIQTLDAVVNK